MPRTSRPRRFLLGLGAALATFPLLWVCASADLLPPGAAGRPRPSLAVSGCAASVRPLSAPEGDSLSSRCVLVSPGRRPFPSPHALPGVIVFFAAASPLPLTALDSVACPSLRVSAGGNRGDPS